MSLGKARATRFACWPVVGRWLSSADWRVAVVVIRSSTTLNGVATKVLTESLRRAERELFSLPNSKSVSNG